MPATRPPSGRTHRAESGKLAVSGADSAGLTRPADPASSATQLIDGFSRYRIGEELGRGGVGLVRAASDPALRRDIAIKTLLRTGGSAVAGFVEEAQITGQLEHPNIVPIHELGTDPHGRPYLTMKRVEGRTLRDLIHESRQRRRTWNQDSARFLEVIAKICDAIGYAHSRGVIHRDLKPENIMIGEYGEVLVMDWGLARPLGAKGGSGSHSHSVPVTSDRRSEPGSGELTMAGDVFGTPAYMAPEQARGDIDQVDERADVFALGGVLYALLTLQSPYSGRDAQAVIEKAAERELILPRRRNAARAIPKELEAIALMAMAPRPQDRYASAADLKDDIHAHLASLPIRARRDPLWTRVVKWSRRHPTAALGGSLSLVFALVLGLLLLQLHAAEQLAAAESARADQQARARAAEQARADAESARRADAEAVAKEREEIVRAMKAGDYDHVLGLLEQQVRGERDDAIHEFIRLWKASKDSGQSETEFVHQLGEQRAAAAIRAFERLMQQHEQRGIKVTAADHFYLALLYHVCEGDLPEALDHYNCATTIDPTMMDAWYNRGIVRSLQGNHAEAIADFDAVLRMDPGLADGWCARGMAKREAGDLDGALTDLNRAIDLAPGNYAAWMTRGSVRSKRGDHTGALADLNESVRLNASSYEVWAKRATVRRDAGDRAGAIADYSKAIELNGQIAGVWNSRAGVKSDTGDVDGAMADYTRAIALEPQTAGFYSNRGALRLKLRDLPGALEDYTKAIQLDPDDSTSFNHRGGVRNALGDLDGAIEDCTRAIELDPANYSAWSNRGAAKVKTGDTTGAIADFTEALDRNRQYWRAWANRGAVRMQADVDRDAGIRDLQQAYRLCPDAPSRDMVAQTLRYYGAEVPE